MPARVDFAATTPWQVLGGATVGLHLQDGAPSGVVPRVWRFGR